MPGARRAKRPGARRSPRAASPAPAAPPALRTPPPLAALDEEPRGHVVCRACGRIQGLELTELDRHLLTEIAGVTPDGWSVERIAFSLAGTCRRCREGPSLP